ncbi:MAG TPA: alpha/beta hydrolase, partial [Humisphaera sp.]
GREPEVFVLLFPGRGGRAEWATRWGVGEAGKRPVEAWSINYPGVGSSPGAARLADVGPAALAAYDFVKARAGDRPVVISGPSFGSAPALYVAARRPVAGLVLSNPPPLRQMILRRHGWWNLWAVAGPAAMAVPADLDSVANAAVAKCPAAFVTSGADDVVPEAYQRLVVDAYAGPKRAVVAAGAGHHGGLSGPAAAERYEAVEWVWRQAGK